MDWGEERRESEGDVERADVGWSEVEFGGIDLGDKRLEQRLKVIAEDLSARPQAPINQASEDWATTKAAQRFFENPKAAEDKIFAAHQECPVRMHGQGLVLAIQDTTYLNYSSHKHVSGLGPIGDSRRDAQGLIMHSTLVVDAVNPGIACQQRLHHSAG